MNIFVLDNNPVKAAKYHCTKHVSKMIIESAQLLATNLRDVHGIDTEYKSTHQNHPCRLWLAESPANMLWLIKLALELCNVYTKKYDKTHKTSYVLQNMHQTIIQLSENSHMTDFALAMPDDCKIFDNAVDCYRYYYVTHKASIVAKYGWPCTQPLWFSSQKYAKVDISSIYTMHNLSLKDSSRLQKLIAKYNDKSITKNEAFIIRKHLFYYATKIGVSLDNLLANYKDLDIVERKFEYVTDLDISIFNLCVNKLFGSSKRIYTYSSEKRKKHLHIKLNIADYVALFDLYEHHKYQAWLQFEQLRHNFAIAYGIKNELHLNEDLDFGNDLADDFVDNEFELSSNMNIVQDLLGIVKSTQHIKLIETT